VTVEAFITSLLSTLTCFGPYRPSSEATSILLETTITLHEVIKASTVTLDGIVLSFVICLSLLRRKKFCEELIVYIPFTFSLSNYVIREVERKR
jgi:hypothetical protein